MKFGFIWHLIHSTMIGVIFMNTIQIASIAFMFKYVGTNY